MLGIFSIGRLTKLWLLQMPVAVALAMLVSGAAVGAFAISIDEQPPSASSGPSQKLTLEEVRPTPGAATSPDPSLETPESQNVTVRGIVADFGGKALLGAVVKLDSFDGTTLLSTIESTTDTMGAFEFKNPDGNAYVVSSTYGSTTYASDVLIANSIVELRVGPSTDDSSVLHLVRDSTVLSGDTKGIQVVQILDLEVAGDAAYLGSIELPLLQGATQFRLRTGIVRQHLRFSEGSVTYESPLRPGKSTLVFEYLLEPPAKKAILVRTATLDVENLELLATGDLALEASSPSGSGQEFEVEEDVALGEGGNAKTYARLVAKDVPRGARFEATIGVQKRPPLAAPAAVVAALVALVYVFRSKAKPTGPPAESATESTGTET